MPSAASAWVVPLLDSLATARFFAILFIESATPSMPVPDILATARMADKASTDAPVCSDRFRSAAAPSMELLIISENQDTLTPTPIAPRAALA